MSQVGSGGPGELAVKKSPEKQVASLHFAPTWSIKVLLSDNILQAAFQVSQRQGALLRLHLPVAGLAVTRASTSSMCSLRGLFLKALLLVFRRVAAWSHFHLPLPNCFSALQGAEGLGANWLNFRSDSIQHCRSG